jgi:type II secretory pathway component GspD/PulD (secretin)
MEGSNIVLKLKNNKIMIFVLFLLFVSIFSINTFAAENNSSEILEQKINIVVEDANLKEIINIIGDVTNLNITHNLKQNNEENENLMNLDFKNVPLEEVLNYITTINDLDYMVKNNIIYIAEESQLSKLYETRIISKVYEYENINKEEIEKVLRNADIVNLDEITITYVTDGMFLFKGEEKNLEKVNSFLINYVKFLNEEQKPDYDLKIIDTRYINDLEKLKLLLKELFHNEIQISIEDDSFIVIYEKGFNIDFLEKKIKEFEDFYSKENTKLEILDVNYLELSQMKTYLEAYFPDLLFQTNENTRQIIVKGSKREVERIKSYISKIDQPKKQVVINVTIKEISHRDLKDLGINPDSLSELQLIETKESEDEEDNNDDKKYTIEDVSLNDITLTMPQFINIIDQNNKANTLANPRLMTLDGTNATMNIGDQIPYKVEEIQDETKTVNTEYRDVGIQLSFTPTIHNNGTIELEFNPSINSLGENLNDNPVIKTRTISTTIRLNNKETFAIGGLIQEQEIEDFAGIPVLKDIPFFGKLFESRKTDKRYSEIIIFITPEIVD